MDIPLRHSFTLNGAWNMLCSSPSSTGESEIHHERGVGAGFELGVEDGTADVNSQVDEMEDVGGLDGSDSDDTSSMSDVAKHPRPSSIREGEFHQGLAVGALFELGVEDDGAAKAQAGAPEEVDGLIESESDDTSSISDGTGSHDYSQILRIDSSLSEHRGPEILQDFARDHMAQTERLLQTIIIQKTDAERKEVWIELRGSVVAKVIDTVERARKAMAEFEESTDSRKVKEERLRRALRIQVDPVQEGKEESQGIVIQDLEFARKEEVVEEGRGDLDHGQDAMRNVIRSQDALLRTVREKNIEIIEAGGSIETESAGLHDTSLENRGQKNVLPQKPSIPGEVFSIEGTSTSVQQMFVETQEKQPSESSKANLFRGERSEMEAEVSRAQIYEMDAEELSSEAKNGDGSLYGLPKSVAELSGQEVPDRRAEAPVCDLQELRMSKLQQRGRLNAMWRVSSAYIEPIAGITNDRQVQTHDSDYPSHELPSDISNSGDAAPWHEILPLGTTLHGTSLTLATITQHAMGDPTSFDDGTDACPHPINSSTGEAPPEAAIEVTTAASLELPTADVDGQETSDIGACVAIAEFNTGLSRFTLRTHLIFSIVYAIWIAVLYRFITTAVC